jgi:trigger factor
VKKVSAPILPELNDEFAKDWGIEEGGMDALKKEIEMGLEREGRNLIASQLRETVFNKLLELNTFDIPNALIDQEIEQMQHASAHEMKTRYGVKDAPRAPRDMFEATARRSVALGLLVRQIVKDHKIELDSSKVAELARSQATAYENPEQMLQYMLNNKNYISNLQAQALEQQVIDKMLETAIVEQMENSYADLIKKNNTHVHDENCEHEHHDHE